MTSDNFLDMFNTATEHPSPSTTVTSKTSKVLSKEDIVNALKEFDGSGLGLLTTKQCKAAMLDIPQLGMTDQQCQDFVQLASKDCTDSTGKIKLDEFASRLALEVKLKQGPKVLPQAHPIAKQTSDNPFLDDVDTSPSPSPRAGDLVLSPSDPSAAISIPEWYGHSLYSPVSENTDDIWGFGNTKKPTNTPTEKIHSPQQGAPSLIAPPRSKGQKAPTEKKRAKSPSPLPVAAFSFAVHFADGGDPAVETPMAKVKSDTTKDDDEKDLGFGLDIGDNLVEPPSEESQPKVETKKSATPTETNGNDSTKKKIDDKANSKEKGKDSETQANTENGKSEEKPKVRTDAVAEMKRGTAMLKYGRRGLPHFRRFQLSEDMTRLIWYSRKKNVGETSVAIADIKEVLEGQQTEVFKQCTQSSLEKASFSIVYGNKMKTLDLVAKSYEEAKLWTKGLRGLMKAQQQGKLHKVAQILVNVDYTDITKPNYRGDGENQPAAIGYDNIELLHAVEGALDQSKKTFKSIQELMHNPDIQKNKEFDAIQQLVSEYEQRFDDLNFALAHKTMALQSLKRDVWVLKVDVTVLHEKLQVLGKSKFHLF